MEAASAVPMPVSAGIRCEINRTDYHVYVPIPTINTIRTITVSRQRLISTFAGTAGVYWQAANGRGSAPYFPFLTGVARLGGGNLILSFPLT